MDSIIAKVFERNFSRDGLRVKGFVSGILANRPWGAVISPCTPETNSFVESFEISGLELSGVTVL
ncbi:hypothetical protein D3C71_2084200 [compost metagenome]